MSEELTLALAKFFVTAWDDFVDGPSEGIQSLIEGSDLATEVIATQEDIDGGEAPEDCEEGETFYVLSPLGQEAWNLVKDQPK
jgi:hypothetical protein